MAKKPTDPSPDRKPAKKSKPDEKQAERKAHQSGLLRRKKRSGEITIVDQVLAKTGWGLAEFARQLESVTGEPVSRQMVDAWRNRGVFPAHWIIAVSSLAGVSVEHLMMAKPRVVDNSIVERAMRIVCNGEPSAAKFAAELSEVSGRKVTPRMVSEWRKRERIPAEYAAWLTQMTRIPLYQLLARDLVVE